MLIAGLCFLAGLGFGRDLPLEEPRTLVTLPLGNSDPGSLRSIKARLESQLGLSVTIRPSVPLPSVAYTRPRNRYRADRLLPWLRQQVSDGFVLGVTSRDISTKLGPRSDWGVFGLGECPARAAVISSFRLRRKGGVSPDERLRRVAVHEVGHNLGLPHCGNTCIMADAEGGIRSVDRFKDFCGDCLSRLR